MRVHSGPPPVTCHGMCKAPTYGKHYSHASKGGHTWGGPGDLRVQEGRYMLARAAAKLTKKGQAWAAYSAGGTNGNDY